MKMPFCKFYPRDWLGNFRLRGCSFAARGLWADMLSIMATADRRGYLESGGKPFDAPEIARRVGGRVAEVKRLLGELETAGVFSRDEAGVIFSRRIVDDVGRSRIGHFYGKRGGNPKLRRTTGELPLTPTVKAGPDSLPLSAPDKLRTQNPEPKDKMDTHTARHGAPAFRPPSLEEVKAEADCAKLPKGEGERFFNYWEANEWHGKNGKPLAKWKNVLRTWTPKGKPTRANAKPKTQTPGSLIGVTIHGTNSP